MRKADNLPPSCAVVTKSGNLNFLETSGPVQACDGTALPLPYILLGCIFLYFFVILTFYCFLSGGCRGLFLHQVTLSVAPQSVGLLWTSDQSVTKTTKTTEHSQQRDIRAPGGIPTRNPSMRAAARPPRSAMLECAVCMVMGQCVLCAYAMVGRSVITASLLG